MTAVHRLGIVYLGFTPRFYTELGDKRIYRHCREEVRWSLKSTNAVEQNSLLMRCFVSRRLHAGQHEAERCNETLFVQSLAGPKCQQVLRPTSSFVLNMSVH